MRSFAHSQHYLTYLPRLLCTEPSPPWSVERQEDFCMTQKSTRVLILEDETLVAWSLSEMLSLVGCEVTGIAATVHDALCLAEVTRPDLAVVDVRLAGRRDGIEGAELLKNQFG